jgi:hypothetical protein
VYFRLNLGCSAAEKTLERKLAETQKKFYRFTNGKGDIDSQIMKKDMQAWTLRDVLHAGGLPPMETRTDVVDFFKPPTLQHTALVGRTSVFEIETDGKGLPMSLPMDIRRVLLRAIKRDVAKVRENKMSTLRRMYYEQCLHSFSCIIACFCLLISSREKQIVQNYNK